MNPMLKKEMRLSALLLTYLFMAFGFMTLIPGYPILCGVFFITLGLFQSGSSKASRARGKRTISCSRRCCRLPSATW